jgi:hypothetical protein
VGGPVGGQFSEDFSQPGSVNRFDFALDGLHPSVDPNTPTHWEGDHNRDCAGPETSRDVQRGTPTDLSDLFWYCAPGGDSAKGHLMSSFITFGYDVLSFSPKQYFTNVSQVCWDQNITFLGGRKWTQVAIIRRADIEREMAEVEDWERQEGFTAGHLNLGFVHFDFRTGSPSNDVEPSNPAIVTRQLLGGFEVSDAFNTLGSINGSADDAADGQIDGYMKYEDVAARFRHCMTDNGNGTITITRARPNGGTLTDTFAGSFPDGQVRVIFEDDQYDGPKDAEYDSGQNTWHWDNISIS